MKNLNKPIHLLGIGKIQDIFDFVPLGIDSFDCVYPTRLARHGTAIVPGMQNACLPLFKSAFSKDERPLDPLFHTIPHSRAYLHHLLKSRELSALSLLSIHNVKQMLRLMKSIRFELAHGFFSVLSQS